MRALAILLAGAALAGCPDYARVVRHDAPGLVPDLDAPLPHENGDPKRREIADGPGTTEHWLWTMPYIVGGVGRGETGAGETGVELRYEHHTYTPAADTFASATTLTAAAGTGYQWRGRRGSFGLVYAEVGARVWGDLPHDFAAGPVLESGAGARGIGGQITYRALMVFPVTIRYTRDGGVEGLVGFQLPMPAVFGSSR